MSIEEMAAAVTAEAERERAQYVKPEPVDGKEPDADQGMTSKEVLDALQRNEDGDAALFIELNRGCFCFDAAEGRWYVSRGHYWEKDTLDEATRAVDGVIEAYGRESQRQAWQRLQSQKAGKTEEEKRHKEFEDTLLRRVGALQAVARKKNVLTLARTGSESLAITGEEWDSNPWLLACQNGIIDLHTGELEPGKPEDFIRTIAPVEYNGLHEPAPTWEKFIKEVCGEYTDLPAYLQRLLGYGITGLANYHVYVIFYGPEGRNGKGTLLETLKNILGNLAHKARSESLLESKNPPSRGSADSDTLALRGKRIVWASETSEGRRLNASRIKELCGGDTLNARGIHARDPVEFRPTHLLILLTNDRPQAPASDSALWERIHLVPFTVRFLDNPTKPNEKKADHDLLDKLKAEAPGVLAWLVRGCLAWQREGLNPPDIVKAATREYRKEEDMVENFLNSRCIIGSDYQTRANILYKAYQSWAEEMGLKGATMTGPKFWKEMQKRFEHGGKRHIFYIGVGLLDETSEG